MDIKMIEKIENVINEKVVSVNQINVGYSREVYLINDKYILKIVHSLKKQNDTIKEIKFLENNRFSFAPNVIFKDFSKKDVPYIFSLETKVSGELLLHKWSDLSNSDQEYVLNQLFEILEIIHSQKNDNIDCINGLLDEYNRYLNKIIDNKLLNNDKIKYLQEIKLLIPTLFENARTGLIHGDLHFNNIIIDSNKELSIIDFEKLKTSYIDREYDPINRMVRNPNSFVNNGLNGLLVPKKFECILEYIKKHSNEISDNKFIDRLLFFDIMNSLMWLPKYPNHDTYNDVLFNKSKTLWK